MKIIQVYRTKKNDYVLNIEHVDENKREIFRYSSRDQAELVQRREARRYRKQGHEVFCDDFTAFKTDL